MDLQNIFMLLKVEELVRNQPKLVNIKSEVLKALEAADRAIVTEPMSKPNETPLKPVVEPKQGPFERFGADVDRRL